MSDKDQCLMLEIITPSGPVTQVNCDSVHLTLSDDQNGQGGGKYGVRKGHASSVLLLATGTTTAQKDGRVILSLQTGSGFATVSQNEVSIVVNHAESEAQTS